MRVIIAGSRTIDNVDEDVYVVGLNGHVQHRNARRVVEDAIVASNFPISLVLSGTADGVDRLGELWALENGVPVAFYPPDWGTHGRRAGFVRNAQMAEDADGLIAVWDGRSPGTKMMIDLAREKELLLYVAAVQPAE